jgi:hypothetical protein
MRDIRDIRDIRVVDPFQPGGGGHSITTSNLIILFFLLLVYPRILIRFHPRQHLDTEIVNLQQ